MSCVLSPDLLSPFLVGCHVMLQQNVAFFDLEERPSEMMMCHENWGTTQKGSHKESKLSNEKKLDMQPDTQILNVLDVSDEKKKHVKRNAFLKERERETVCSVCTFCVNSLLPSFSAFCISKSVLLFFFFLFLLLQSLHHNVIIIIPPPFQSREECRTVIQTRIMYCVSWRHSFVRKNESEWKRSMLLVPMMRKPVKHNQCKKKELQFHVVYLSLLIRWR